ncbi:MAG: divergent polysaccharide deacetylase family protein [Pseudohongiella sp.]|nr:divergent polysaccharide deacetylase family protein [Pseudohongiella sp.]
MLESVKALWQKFIKQPTNIHLLLAGGLILLAISLLTPAGPGYEHSLQEHEPQSHNLQDLSATDPTHTEQGTAPDIEPEPSITFESPDRSGVVIADGRTETEVPSEPSAKLVLILDDIGYNAEAGRRAINLPGQVTYAVIPYTPHGKTLAEAAHRAHKEVMLHAPMSNLSGMDLGEGGLTLLQNEEEFLHTLRLALADIPHIKGVNNHTGSELTAAAQPMQWVMQELKQHGLYFVDSVTTNASVAATTAEQYQVPALRRHVFLDNVQTAEAIDFEFRRALALAHKQGFAVVIGHPYPETLTYLEAALPWLAAQNIQLISASTMIAQLQKPDPVKATAAW